MDSSVALVYYSDMLDLAAPVSPSALLIERSALVRCPAEWHWGTRDRPVRIPCFNLWAVCGGRGTLETSEGTFALRRGDCFLLHRDLTVAGSHDAARPLVVSYTRFEYAPPGGAATRGGPCPPLHRTMDDMMMFEGILRRMQEAHASRAGSDVARSWLAAALLEVGHRDSQAAVAATEPVGYAVVLEAATRISEDPARWPSVSALARSFDYSADHFTRLFRRIKGVTPQAFILHARLERAASLLSTSTMAVGRIADRLGYADVHFFSRQFKAHMGVTPSRWRRTGGRAG